MAIFAYQAYTKTGRKTKGTLEASGENDAKEKIRTMELILFDLAEERLSKGVKQLTKDSLVIFTSQLAQLISAKIPLYESLVALEEQARNEPYHGIILSLSERIRVGTSLSKAMGDFPQSFSPLYRALISAGEAIGNLELPLTRLTSLLSYQRKMSKQLMSALAYPMFLMGLMVVAITILLGFVIPSLENLFEGRAVPWFTATVFQMSSILRTFWPLLLAAAITGGFFAYRQLKKKKTKAKIQRLLLHTPVVRRYMIHAALSRFARTFATLLEGGLPLTSALSYASEALHNARLEEIFGSVIDRVVEGKPISSELREYREIPPLFCRMVKIGEESGKLAPMLTQVATIYEEETERTLNRLVTLAQPILLIVMGALIGGVILSILLPLSDFGANVEI